MREAFVAQPVDLAARRSTCSSGRSPGLLATSLRHGRLEGILDRGERIEATAVRTPRRVASRCCLLSMALVQGALGQAVQHKQLDRALEQVSAGFRGRAGVCVLDQAGASCIRGSQSFSMQSVMKLVVSMAVLDAIDHHRLGLDDHVMVHRQDLSLDVEPLAELVGPEGYRTTIRDLIHRAVVDSDSAASDILARRIGGTQQVQSFLDRKGVQGVRIDRDERHLQTEIAGLTWRSEYVDPRVLNKAIEAVPARERDAAYHRYQVDSRDSATPYGMASLLQRLSNGDLLSPASTHFILETMAETATFPDRLKAGVPAGWTCMHKTGSSGTWQGVTAAANDVGILRTPDGRYIAIAVFVADTREPYEARARVIRCMAAETVKSFR